MKGIKFMSAAMLCLAALSGTAFAKDEAFELPQTSSAYVKDFDSFKLAAANETAVLVKKSNSAAPVVKQAEVEPAMFSAAMHTSIWDWAPSCWLQRQR